MDHVIHGRRWNAKKGVIDTEAGESLYADDAAFLFASRKSLCECAVIIDRHFTGFGLQVHKGSQGRSPKQSACTSLQQVFNMKMLTLPMFQLMAVLPLLQTIQVSW